MKRGVAAIAVVMLLGGYSSTGFAEGKPADVFVSQKCNLCHSLKAAGIEAKVPKPKGGDLSGIGSQHDADWIRGVVKQETMIAGTKHPIPFKGSDEQLKTLADWLAAQKSAQ
jgi:mono/diheme cytochrome c family protein